MPCDQVIRVAVALELADRDLLEAALRTAFSGSAVGRDADGTLWAYSSTVGRFTIDTAGKLHARVRNEDDAVDLGFAVKREYTRQTLRRLARGLEFDLQPEGTPDRHLGQTRYRLVKACALLLAVLLGLAGSALAHPTIEQKRPCHDERPCVVAGGQHHEEGPRR